MITLFHGHDSRESVGTHVFIQSVLDTSSVPVSFIPLHKPMLSKALGFDIQEGTNAFTLSRFLIPWLMDWRGWAIFADGADMMLKADIAELAALYDPWRPVQVVKHDYQSSHRVKYRGTLMEAENTHYQKKNWASLMLINCSHFGWRKYTPKWLRSASKLEVLTFAEFDESDIGALPIEWNWLADEYGENKEAKLLHWTAGVPGFRNYATSPHADEWFRTKAQANYATD